MRRTVMFKGIQEKASEELFTVSVEKKVIIFYHFFVDKLNTLTISWLFLTYPVTL